MTRKFFLKSLVVACLLTGATACRDDEKKWEVVDGGTPQINLALSRIRTDYDLQFKIRGTIKDADGISSIRLVCPGLSLDKTIDIIGIYDEPLKEYDLDYAYTVKQDYLTDFTGSYEIDVTVTDVAGNTETKTVTVTFDADFQAPTFLQAPDSEVTVLIKDQTLFNLKFTVEDNRNLDFVEIDLEGVEGYPVRIEANGEPKIVYSQKLELPSAAKNYNLTITAQDMPAQDDEVRTTVVKSVIKVQDLPDFDRVYLADVASAEELNADVFGVPMACDHVGPFQYRVRYYNATAGTQVCFIPQKTDFFPICFGPDPDKEGFLGDNPETSGKITLNEAGVYYQFDFNTKTGVYSYKTYSIADASDPIETMTYGQEQLNTWNDWNAPWWQPWTFGPSYISGQTVADRISKNGEYKTHSIIEVKMVRDATNPHIWVSEDWDLKAGETDEWVMHNWHNDGWWNYTGWRMDDPNEPSRCFYYGYVFDDNEKFRNNHKYFEDKYGSLTPAELAFMYPDNGGAAFDLTKWGQINENYAKTFVKDIKVKANIPTSGKYRIWFDAHSEHIKLIPVK